MNQNEMVLPVITAGANLTTTTGGQKIMPLLIQRVALTRKKIMWIAAGTVTSGRRQNRWNNG